MSLPFPPSPDAHAQSGNRPALGRGGAALEAEPAQLLPVYRRHPETGFPVEGHLEWGLIHHSAPRYPEVRPIHARAETLTEKPIFADAYKKRRCIVPMNRFYLKDERRKRYAISKTNGEIFGVAGIWENWRDPESGEWLRSFAIVTVTANAMLAQINARMPAILDREHFARWLGVEEDPRDLLKPYPPELLQASPRIGTSRRR